MGRHRYRLGCAKCSRVESSVNSAGCRCSSLNAASSASRRTGHGVGAAQVCTLPVLGFVLLGTEEGRERSERAHGMHPRSGPLWEERAVGDASIVGGGLGHRCGRCRAESWYLQQQNGAFSLRSPMCCVSTEGQRCSVRYSTRCHLRNARDSATMWSSLGIPALWGYIARRQAKG